MELVSPAYRAEQGPTPGNTRPQKPARVIESDELPAAQNEASSRVSTFESSSKQIIVENNFYTVTLDNKNGGSFSSFELTRYSRDDTSSVNLIDSFNKNNLLVSFVSLDGELVPLNHNWVVIGDIKKIDASQTQKSVLYQTKFGGNTIQKKLTFYPSSYKIDLEVSFNNPDRFVSRGEYYLNWDGGISSSEKNTKDDYTYFKGYAYLGDELLDVGAQEDQAEVENQRGQTGWTAVKSKYFIAAIIPETAGLGATISGLLEGDRPVYSTQLVLPTTTNRSTLYVGPQDYKIINGLDVGLEKTMNLGWALFRPLGRLITWSLTKMYAIIPNYGLVVIIFAVLVKLLLNPLTKQSFVSNKKMQALQPEIQKLKEKFKNDPQKANRAQMQLFKDRGVNPMGGCLPLLLQMPILISFFTVFRSTIEFRGAPFFGWITDLSAPDTLMTVAGLPINILPVLMGGTMFLQQKLMATPGAGGQQKFMLYFMNVFFLFLFYSFPSGLNLYYSVFNVLSIVQQKYLIPDVVLPPAKTPKNKK